MSANFECKCGWHTEARVNSQVEAEVLADRHESADYRRPYRHNVTVLYREER